MKNRFVRYVLIVLLCGWCHTAAFAIQYDRNDPAQGWGYQPVYAAPTVPTYRFYSTSPYGKSISASKSGSFMRSKPRRDPLNPNEDEDDPIGQVPDPAPIGDAPWLFLLLLAAGYKVRKQ